MPQGALGAPATVARTVAGGVAQSGHPPKIDLVGQAFHEHFPTDDLAAVRVEHHGFGYDNLVPRRLVRAYPLQVKTRSRLREVRRVPGTVVLLNMNHPVGFAPTLIEPRSEERRGGEEGRFW